MSRRALWFGVAGVPTGALSAATISALAHAPGDTGLLIIYFAPGAIFGVVFAPLMACCGWMSPVGTLPWFACATLGNAVAVSCVIALTWRLQSWFSINETLATMATGVLGGTLGGGILAAATLVLIPGTRWLIPTLAGGVFGLSLVLLGEPMSAGTFAFYATWQGGYAAALALALSAAARKPR